MWIIGFLLPGSFWVLLSSPLVWLRGLIKQTRDVFWAVHPGFWNTSFQLGEKQFVSSSAAPRSIPAIHPRFHGMNSSLHRNWEQQPKLQRLRQSGGKPLLLVVCGEPHSFHRHCSHFHSESGWLWFTDISSCSAFPAGLTSPLLGNLFIPFGNAFRPL